MPDAHSPQTCGGPALLGSRLVERKGQGGEGRGEEERRGGNGEKDGRGV